MSRGKKLPTEYKGTTLASRKEYSSTTGTTPADWGITDTSAIKSGFGDTMKIENIGKRKKK